MSSPVSEQDGEDPGESTSDNGTVHKRPRSSPTLLTPQRHLKQVPLRELVVALVRMELLHHWCQERSPTKQKVVLVMVL